LPDRRVEDTRSDSDRRAAAGITLTPPLPRFAQVEPVGRCNLACRMCAVNERGDEIAELPLERLRELLDAMPQLEELHLQGLGEPMLHPRFFDMVTLAAARGLRVTCNTNLTLLTEARARRCADSGLATVYGSIDGASAAVYESIRHKASFAKVLRNLRRLTAARDEAGSALSVVVVMVLQRANLEELPALLRLVCDHGVRELQVQRLARDLQEPALPERYIPIARYVADAELRPQDLERAAAVFEEAREVAAELGMRVHLPRLGPAPAATGGGPRCTWPWEQLYLTAAGHMLPCCIVGTADVATFGKMFGSDPLAVWHGAAAQAFRRALADGPPPGVCGSCALYHHRF
jgi:MoaA/NifB/PqqE/SkfB family radical SAM enzyme